ncbi:MAG: hopanoid biosynthesis protein HpnM [Gammaproteobacteria bacterium HGW-Gammaproteobacteria-3]|nr:MAG: hopanoid biosynthesis protein HpnM [Gammaproteobacteria bacterium HGW-Gammaproteobacteria-3]
MYRIFKSTRLPALIVLFLVCVGQAYAEQDNVGAREVVESFQSELIAVMKKGKELGYEGRFDRLFGPVTQSHDLIKIVRIVVGREWDRLSAEQQNQLVDVFTRLSVASYAHNFKEFTGEAFKFDAEEEMARGGAIVHSHMIIPGDKDVKFDYMLKKKANSWKIINIIANGVSDLALKRSEYTAILKREGFSTLIAKINEKINNYSQK